MDAEIHPVIVDSLKRRPRTGLGRVWGNYLVESIEDATAKVYPGKLGDAVIDAVANSLTRGHINKIQEIIDSGETI